MATESCEATEATSAAASESSSVASRAPATLPLPFEAHVAQKSRRWGNPDFVVGYYVSLRLLHAFNERFAQSERVAKAALHEVVRASGNARMFKKASLATHKRVDDVFITASDAERPATLERSELSRLRQVAKRANQAGFCARMKRLVPNGAKLLHRIQDELAAAVAKYTLAETNQNNAVLKETEGDTKTVVEIVDHCSTTTSAPVQSDTITRRRSSSLSRPSSPLKPAHPRFPVVQIPNATVESIRSETSVHRAYEIWQKSPLRFAAYRAFFKNDHTQLATEIAHNCVDKHTKKEIRKWIRAKIGAIPACTNERKNNSNNQETAKTKQSHKGRVTKQSAFFNWELRQLAFVAAGITVYGEHVLSALYDTSAMESLRDIPLVSDEVRDARKQKKCLQRAQATRSIVQIVGEGGNAYHAAHYLPLDLTIQWNNALPPEFRLSADDLRSILNRQCNLKAVPTRVNIKDHRKVEHFIAAFIKYGSLRKDKCATWLEWRNIKDRLDQIAKRVQSPELRDAFLRVNGQGLYALIGRTFQRIETEFVDRGYDFGKIWDRQEESDVRDDARLRVCPLLR